MKKLVILVLTISLFSLVYASMTVGDEAYGIDKLYGPGDNIRGWINISLNDESVASIFNDFRGNEISLIDLLKSDVNSDYSCVPIDCETDYSASNPEKQKSFDMVVGGSKILGLKITGTIENIDAVNFTIQSNAGPSCYNQLKIDILGDGVIDSGNTKSSAGSCDVLKDYSCFDDTQTTKEYNVVEFCQKIKLSESPGFKVGAWVKNLSNSEGEVIMKIKNRFEESIEGAECKLENIPAEGEEVSCEINYLVTKPEDYLVCLSTSASGYKARGYADNEGCDSTGNAAYQIFAEGKMFGSIGELRIENLLSNGDTISDKVNDYLHEKYGLGIDCTQGCVVPIKFISNKVQTVTIKDFSIKYKDSVGTTKDDNLYDLDESYALVDAKMQKISLNNGGFSVPDSHGQYIFELSFGNENIFSENVSVQKVPIIKGLTPTLTFSSYPTNFEVIANATEGTIIKYEWDFGDEGTSVTTSNNVIHTYDSLGDYQIKVTVTNSKQLSSSRTFDISVDSAREAINQTIVTLKNNLIKVKSQISKFDEFEQKAVNLNLGLEEAESELVNLQRSFAQAFDDEEEYNKIMTALLKLKVPESISKSQSVDKIIFYPEGSNVDLKVLKEIGGGNYSDDDAYIDAVISWHQEHINSRISFREFSVTSGDSTEPLTRVFTVYIDEAERVGYNSYFILEKLDNLTFKENYLESEKSGYYYFDLNRFPKEYEFSTIENVNFVNLPAFIAPSLDRLEIVDIVDIKEREEEFDWFMFILIFILLFLIGLTIYIILQRWYKYKYEKYLFPNRNNLYNLIKYVQYSKKNGIKDSEIIAHLKKSGWKGEQLKYITRKYLGKRTGMIEIPVEWLFNLFKKKQAPRKPLPPGVVPRNIPRRRF